MLTIESHASQVNDKGGGWVTRKVFRRERIHQMKEGASMKGFGSGVNDDFELKEGDTITEVVGGIPSVHFYDKARGLIEKSMARSMITKLLGREWNEFYLVKFQGERDYTKALIVGPWLVFGQHLTAVVFAVATGHRRRRSLPSVAEKTKMPHFARFFAEASNESLGIRRSFASERTIPPRRRSPRPPTKAEDEALGNGAQSMVGWRPLPLSFWCKGGKAHQSSGRGASGGMPAKGGATLGTLGFLAF
ncbi:hypothetical protein Gotur_035444 [Gossypium turneri]